GVSRRINTGWVPLFNGKDLTGWKPHPKQAGTWKVVDGILVSTGGPGLLVSKRGDFRNFRLHVEAAVNEKSDEGSVYFRAGTDLTHAAPVFDFPPGYRVGFGQGQAGTVSFTDPDTRQVYIYGSTAVIRP